MDTNLINFLEPIFETKIKCSVAEDDYHSIGNLVSKNKRQCDLGFMAYRVVKPPADIEMELTCHIELCLVKIWPKIDSLKSTGFEIHVKSEKQLEYQKIGSHFNLKENGIQFINNRASSHLYDGIPDSQFTTAFFYNSAHRPMKNVKSIKLSIRQTERCCVPVIKRIEIWGKISELESIENKSNITRIISEEAESKIKHLNCSKGDQNGAEAKTDESASLIPEAFLDAITYEIMALPMVLPSGKVIDNLTLLRHNAQEEKWGRTPSDPFTGQAFNESRKPILNDRLKSQIDAFLLANSDVPALSNVPRTVGPVGKRRLSKDRCIGDAGIVTNKVSKVENTIKLPESTATSTSNGLINTALPSTSSETCDRQMLSNAVQNILKSRKYTKVTRNRSRDAETEKCFQSCETQLNCNNILYNIKSCLHFICRHCLVERNLTICKCGNSFSNVDVNKYHGKTVL